MYAGYEEIMHERVRQEVQEGKEREQVVLNCQVSFGTRSQSFSVCSRLRGDLLSSLPPVDLPFPTAQRLCKAPESSAARGIPQEISQQDSPSLKFYQFYLCLGLFETHLWRLKLQQTTDWAAHQNNYKNSSTQACQAVTE